jgi:CubicO group peptidase (beta-lactamase class C family)
MRSSISYLIQSIFISVFFICPSSTIAQVITNPDSLPKNSFAWNQQEKELGFSHFDEVFKARDVPNGKKIHELPMGAPIVAFSKGGQKENALDSFIKEQKVAGLLILQNGKIRMEYYGLGYNESERWTSQSVAKSVTSTLVGAAIQDGYIKSVDDYLTTYIPDLKGSAYEKVTIRHLLTMTTGVKWTEKYTDSTSDIVRFYTQPVDSGVDQTVSYMRRLPREAEPGKKWVYKTGETHLLGVLVSAATKQTLSAYLSSKIWIPYGMEGKATWNTSRTNQEFSGCCLQMKLRDYGRFGLFILDSARINGKSIVPADYLQAATHTQVSVFPPNWGYGYQWWTKDDGTFRALGIYGQMIHIDPARHLVVVLNSAWPEAENYNRSLAAANFLKSLNQEIDKEAASQ